MATTVPNTFVNGTNADATQVNANFTALTTAIDGVAAEAGVQTPAVKSRGSAIIGASEARTNTAYGLMTTPDRVTGLVVPANGLLVVAFQATWFESVSGQARAAIFIGSNQIKVPQNGTLNPVVQEVGTGGGVATTATPLTTVSYGLASGNAAVSYGGDVTTGQIIAPFAGSAGGPLYLSVAAGTYDVSVQFKAASGSVTAQNRKLWAWVEGGF